MTLEGLALDLIIAVVVGALMLRGWRRSGIHAAAALVGLLLGLGAAAVAVRMVPYDLVAPLGPPWLLRLCTYLLLGAVGYAIGRRFGAFLTRSVRGTAPTLLDRGLGVAVYGAASLVVCIVLAATIAQLPYRPLGDAAENSILIRNLTDDVTAGEIIDRFPGVSGNPRILPEHDYGLPAERPGAGQS